VFVQSQWLDENEDCDVKVEVGNIFGLPTASVMLVVMAPDAAAKIVFPDRLWQVLAAAAETAPALPDGITNASTSGRGARGQVGADARRIGVPTAWSAASACMAGMDEDGRCGTATETTPLCSVPLSNKASHYSGSRNMPSRSPPTNPELSR
jgi:hypothetical protein